MTWRIESSAPNSRTGGASGNLVGFILPIGHGQPFADQNRADIGLADGAGGEKALIFIALIASALDGLAAYEIGQALVCHLAAIPGCAVLALAGLGKFGSVDAEEANALTRKHQCIAIGGASTAGQGIAGRIELDDQPGGTAEKHDGGEHPGEVLEAGQRPFLPRC